MQTSRDSFSAFTHRAWPQRNDGHYLWKLARVSKRVPIYNGLDRCKDLKSEIIKAAIVWQEL
jgi:hypothetical protein